MSVEATVIISACLFAIAILYASVGQAGASGYLAVMALFGLMPVFMRPTALILNVIVATITTVAFYRAGHVSWPLLWPFAVASIPCAFLGGLLALPAPLYRPLVGAALLLAAYRLLRGAGRAQPHAVHSPPLALSLAAGAGIGLLSGLTGVGGGVFLTPLLLVMGWAETRAAAGASAAFILVNSLAGLSGLLLGAARFPAPIPLWALVVLVGGWIGAEYGSRRLTSHSLHRLLAALLVFAGLKFIANL